MDLDDKHLREFFPLEAAEGGREALKVLGEDVDHFVGLLKSSSRDRRAYVRALFSLVEAWIFTMKQTCLAYHAAGLHKYDEADLSFLKEQRYGINEKDGLSANDWFIATDKNLRVTCKLYQVGTGASFKLNPAGEDPGWAAFKEAKKIRDRLTHPTSAYLLDVSDKELATVRKMHAWALEVMVKLPESTPPPKKVGR